MSGLMRLVVLGAISAGVAGAFVVVKNRQHALGDQKRSLEAEIIICNKRIDTAELQLVRMTSPGEVESRLESIGWPMIVIERTEKVTAGIGSRTEYASYSRYRPTEGQY